MKVRMIPGTAFKGAQLPSILRGRKFTISFRGLQVEKANLGKWLNRLHAGLNGKIVTTQINLDRASLEAEFERTGVYPFEPSEGIMERMSETSTLGENTSRPTTFKAVAGTGEQRLKLEVKVRKQHVDFRVLVDHTLEQMEWAVFTIPK
jgi:hypothetical protein